MQDNFEEQPANPAEIIRNLEFRLQSLGVRYEKQNSNYGNPNLACVFRLMTNDSVDLGHATVSPDGGINFTALPFAGPESPEETMIKKIKVGLTGPSGQRGTVPGPGEKLRPDEPAPKTQKENSPEDISNMFEAEFPNTVNALLAARGLTGKKVDKILSRDMQGGNVIEIKNGTTDEVMGFIAFLKSPRDDISSPQNNITISVRKWYKNRMVFEGDDITGNFVITRGNIESVANWGIDRLQGKIETPPPKGLGLGIEEIPLRDRPDEKFLEKAKTDTALIKGHLKHFIKILKERRQTSPQDANLQGSADSFDCLIFESDKLLQQLEGKWPLEINKGQYLRQDSKPAQSMQIRLERQFKTLQMSTAGNIMGVLDKYLDPPRTNQGMQILLNNLLRTCEVEQIFPKIGQDMAAVEHEAAGMVPRTPGAKPFSIHRVLDRGLKDANGRIIKKATVLLFQ